MYSDRFKEFEWMSSVASFTSSEKKFRRPSSFSGIDVLACSIRDDTSSMAMEESLPRRIHSHHREPYQPWTMVTACSA